jgi:hypothetical protein
MRKFTHLDDLDRPHRRRSRAPLLLLLLVALAATPLLYEAAQLHLSNWGLFGLGRVDTPILDALRKHWEAGHSEFRDWVTPRLVNYRWSPRLVLPIAFFWAGVAALMLRRGH